MARKSPAGWLLVLLAVAGAFAVSGCAKLKARDDLNKGVEAYKNAQFDRAIEYFKDAQANDPKLLNARLYLGTAYASQYIPGAPSDENRRNGEAAIQVFKQVLQDDPNNLTAIDGIGSMLYNMAGTPFNRQMMEEAKTYHERHIQVKPSDPTPYYWVGVIDYWIAFRTNAQLRSDYNLKAKKPIRELDPLPAAIRDEFIKQAGSTIDDGMQNLQRAIRAESRLRQRHGLSQPPAPRKGRHGNRPGRASGGRKTSRRPPRKGQGNQPKANDRPAQFGRLPIVLGSSRPADAAFASAGVRLFRCRLL